MSNSPRSRGGSRQLAGLSVAAALLASLVAVLSAPASALAEPGVGAVAWGDNSAAQLGAGYKNPFEESPVSVLGLSNVASVALGYHLSVALLGDGTVRTWGGNVYGQLGDKTHVASGSPVDVGLRNVKQIAAGGAHVLALLEDGTVENWGANEFGQLGNGLLNPVKRTTPTGGVEWTMQGSGSDEPVRVPALSTVVAVAIDGGSAFALLADGTVRAWGRNDRGQLGIGVLGPQVCNSEIGEVPCETNPQTVRLTNHEPLHGVKAIAAGSEAAYALLTNGTVMAWGNNGRGQLGNGTTVASDVAAEVKRLSGVLAISAGGSDALALLSSGRVAGWGGDNYGQLGPQADESCQTHACVESPSVIPGLENIASVSAGRGFTLALAAGKLWSFGDNEPWGQLGTGGLLSTATPKPLEGLPPISTMDAGEQHAIAVLQSGSGPAPRFSVTPASGRLNVTWTVSALSAALRWRPAASYGEGGTWSPAVTFKQPCSASAPCSYTISGLSPVSYEVELNTALANGTIVSRKTIASP